ncbi:MAG: hypothetical protein E3K32_00120 [wastewater metagenome]|nr:hypothetical protein [Candidatus Loosdrechtia aerotolerans]
MRMVSGIKNSKQLNLIEVDPGEKSIERLEDRRAELCGIVEKHRGIERRDYPVIMIKNISVLSPDR